MVEGTLTREQILTAAEDVLRRFGPSKATVVDVARALGVTHGSVYRHFPSKTALREAVTKRWLDRAHEPLIAVVTADDPAPARLRRWLTTLCEGKRRNALDDPELFATYSVLGAESSTMVAAHIDFLVGHLTEIIAAGIEHGDFNAADPEATARAVFDATAKFHNPRHAAEWSDPRIETEFDAVCSLILSGLLARRDQ
jgi:AcrR family transcriptional regulator